MVPPSVFIPPFLFRRVGLHSLPRAKEVILSEAILPVVSMGGRDSFSPHGPQIG
jgi:hypothetical protein